MLALGGVGYAIQASLFYAALQRGSAAAVALLFYAYPAVVTLVEAAISRQRPSGRLLAGLALSGAGTLLVVLAGSDVSITPAGTAFALVAAGAFALYLLAGAGAAPRTSGSPGGAMVIGAWVAAGAALSLTSVGVAAGGLRWPGEHWWLMAATGLATASAFALLFAALERLGASRTAVVMTLEALSAVVLGALLLGESLGPVQLVGGLAIVAATMVISTAGAPAAARSAPQRDEPVSVLP
ncbi:MAG: DMT family transporter [Actinobacteria bacterium]|nr:DMT family transporter [Actinomycetota bacterium]